MNNVSPNFLVAVLAAGFLAYGTSLDFRMVCLAMGGVCLQSVVTRNTVVDALTNVLGWSTALCAILAGVFQ